jgi:hypothetical protein
MLDNKSRDKMRVGGLTAGMAQEIYKDKVEEKWSKCKHNKREDEKDSANRKEMKGK